VVTLEAFEAFFSALGLLGALAGAELVDEALLGLDLGLLLLERSALVFDAFGTQGAELFVVAGVLDHLPGFEFVDLGDHPVEQPTVVRNQHNAATVLGEEAFEPFSASDVEVVGGFVEQQQVGFTQQEFG